MNRTETAATPPAACHLLLVEDDTQLAEVLELGLQEEQIFVRSVSRARDALAALAEQRIDLILLDVGLPGIDGFEFLRQLQEDPRWSAIPVIILTARNRTDDKLRGFSLGAADFVTKPFN